MGHSDLVKKWEPATPGKIMLIQNVSLVVYREIQGTVSTSFALRIIALQSDTHPATCTISVVDTFARTKERVFQTHGDDPFQALFLAMKTALRLLRRHCEGFPDDLFYLDPDETQDAMTGIEMIDWLGQAYSGLNLYP